MTKLFDRLQKLVEAALAIMLAVMMCVVFAQTFTRYIVFHSIPWSEELSRFLFVGIIVLGINLGISRNQMVRIDILDNYLGGKAVRYAEIIRNLIGLVMNGAFAYSTFDLIKIGQMQKSPSLQLPMSVMYILLLVGFVLACVSILFKIVQLIQEGRQMR